ncbi:hypothetical protein [Microbacterium sp.]
MKRGTPWAIGAGAELDASGADPAPGQLPFELVVRASTARSSA